MRGASSSKLCRAGLSPGRRWGCSWSWKAVWTRTPPSASGDRSLCSSGLRRIEWAHPHCDLSPSKLMLMSLGNSFSAPSRPVCEHGAGCHGPLVPAKLVLALHRPGILGALGQERKLRLGGLRWPVRSHSAAGHRFRSASPGIRLIAAPVLAVWLGEGTESLEAVGGMGNRHGAPQWMWSG